MDRFHVYEASELTENGKFFELFLNKNIFKVFGGLKLFPVVFEKKYNNILNVSY